MAGQQYNLRSKVEKIILTSPTHIKKNAMKPEVSTRSEQFQCILCENFYSSTKSLERHKKTHGDGKLQCPLCTKAYTERNLLEYHLNEHTGQKPFKCESCDESFSTTHDRRTHVKKVHKKELLHRCDKCLASFIWKSRLLEHQNVHMSANERKLARVLFKCPICEKVFTKTNRRNINDHKLLHENPSQFACSVCKKIYVGKSSLDRHKLLHGTKRKFTCMFCQMKFTRFDELNLHIRNHTGEKPYKCKYCSKTFLQLCNLQDHERSCCKGVEKLRKAKKTRHSPVINLPTPFQCSFCMDTFKTNKNMKFHISRVHKGERPFACSFCTKKFASKHSLENHIRAIHTKERIHGCNLCEKKYRVKEILELHIRSVHTKEKPYVCNLCDRTFCGSSNLRKHSVSRCCQKNK